MPGVRNLGAVPRWVKSAVALIGCEVLHKLANSLDRPAPFLEHRGKHMPRVNHVRPHFELDVDTGRAGRFRTTKVVIQQGFRGAYLNQQRWKPRHVGVDRRH